MATDDCELQIIYMHNFIYIHGDIIVSEKKKHFTCWKQHFVVCFSLFVLSMVLIQQMPMQLISMNHPFYLEAFEGF